MPTSLGAGCGGEEGRPKKCQPLSMVTLIMSKFSLVGAESKLVKLAEHATAGSVPSVAPSALLPKAMGPEPRHTFRPVAGVSFGGPGARGKSEGARQRRTGPSPPLRSGTPASFAL